LIEQRFTDSSLQRPVYDTPADRSADVYNMGVFRYESLYIGTPAIYYHTDNARNDGFHHVQLVCSRDLRSWTRLGDRQPFIGPSPMGAGAYDTQQIIGPSSPVVRGDELWFYYTGIKYRDAPEHPDPDQGAICLAVLRRDGFISLDAGEQEGTVTTKPFKLTGARLYVNVDAPKGELCIEALDGNGKVLAMSNPVKGDLARAEVPWSDAGISALSGQVVSLRFRLRQGSLYSYWIGGAVSTEGIN
jgi:hypothetical protein